MRFRLVFHKIFCLMKSIDYDSSEYFYEFSLTPIVIQR